MNRVQERVTMFNWQGILNVIPPMPAQAALGAVFPVPQPVNLLTNYGQLSMAQVQAHAEIFMAIDGRDKQTPAMLYMFLSNSLDTAAHNTLDISP
jgi:hypothetical protein